MGRLRGKVALITGAGSGIGAATARLFAAEGAKVAVAAQEQASADQIVQQIEAAGGHAVGIAGDLAEERQIEALVGRALSAFGRIDVLHNNAALTDMSHMARDTDVVRLEREVFDLTIAVNLRAPMLMCKHVIPHMLKQGGGTIVMTGSGKGIQGDIEHTAYGASKAGLINLTKNVAAQYGKQRIRANILIVGLVMSDALKTNLPKPMRDMIESHHLTPYLGEPEHVAQAALFLASDESAFVTGHELYVDGGVTSHAPFFADLRKLHGAA